MGAPKSPRLMKKILCILCIAVALSSVCLAGPIYTFELTNNTGYDIEEVWIGPAGNEDWEDDDELLHGKSFKNGETIEITYEADEEAPTWDLLVSWVGDYPDTVWENVGLVHGGEYALHYDRKTGVTSLKKI